MTPPDLLKTTPPMPKATLVMFGDDDGAACVDGVCGTTASPTSADETAPVQGSVVDSDGDADRTDGAGTHPGAGTLGS